MALTSDKNGLLDKIETLQEEKNALLDYVKEVLHPLKESNEALSGNELSLDKKSYAIRGIVFFVYRILVTCSRAVNSCRGAC